MKRLSLFLVLVQLSVSVFLLPATDATKPSTHPYNLKITKRFPRPQLPKDNRLTVEGVTLGKKLFFDRQLSKNNSQSCADCHNQQKAFTDNGKKLSIGVEGMPGERNAMVLFNLAWNREFFWDGRAKLIRDQALMAIENEVEMNESLDNVIQKIAKDHEYKPLFQAAFNIDKPTSTTISLAIEQYVLTLLSSNSKFDKAMLGQAVLTEQEKRGLELFSTEYDPMRKKFGADCFHCHGNNLFTNQQFANNGLDKDFIDTGRYRVTKRDSDKGKFKVPSLRNVAVSAPYMHDGRFETLEEVIEHYNSGIQISPTLDPNLFKHHSGIKLSKEDKSALVAFLKTLTDEQFLNNPIHAK